MGRKQIDLTGRKFGRWTVLGPDPESSAAKETRWICRCECGNQKSVARRLLMAGESQSCGCLQRERTKRPKNRADLTGRRFGKLEVLGLSHIRNKQTYWRCRCECGNEYTVRCASLTSGMTKSCGCEEAKNRKKVNARIAPYMQDGTNVAMIRSSRPNSQSKSGVRGVWFSKRDQRWVANITLAGKKHSKAFKNFEDAVAWRREKEEELFRPIIDEFTVTNSRLI